MAFDSTEVLVAGSATLYLATQGATVPTGLTTPGGQWTNVGYIDENGATFNLEKQQNNVYVWQSLDPIRVINTSFTKSVSCVLRQWDPSFMYYSFGGGTSVMGTGATGGTAYGTYTYPAASENPTLAAILDTVDGSYTVRFYWPSMIVSGSISVALGRTDSMTLPITLTSLTSSSQPKILSNAPGWTA